MHFIVWGILESLIHHFLHSISKQSSSGGCLEWMVLVEETSVAPSLKCLQHRSALKADLNLSLSLSDGRSRFTSRISISCYPLALSDWQHGAADKDLSLSSHHGNFGSPFGGLKVPVVSPLNRTWQEQHSPTEIINFIYFINIIRFYGSTLLQKKWINWIKKRKKHVTGIWVGEMVKLNHCLVSFFFFHLTSQRLAGNTTRHFQQKLLWLLWALNMRLYSQHLNGVFPLEWW